MGCLRGTGSFFLEPAGRGLSGRCRQHRLEEEAASPGGVEGQAGWLWAEMGGGAEGSRYALVCACHLPAVCGVLFLMARGRLGAL